ncbi:MAG: hypothetical protein U0168_26790 [Nannocystaceae bacterium]
MQRAPQGFEASFRRHLALEQRRAVLELLGGKMAPESTVGQLADAAAALGWIDFGELSLSDLADALLDPSPGDDDASAGLDTASLGAALDDGDDEDADEDADDENADDEDADDEDADEDEDEDEQAPAPAKTRGRKVAAKPAKPAKPAPRASKAKPEPAKVAGKGKAGKGKPTKISLDERMNLDEAAAVLLPLVRELGEATMQQLEQATAGGGRRKLRFHIGQLVKHGKLERHGMGRGTYYTVA